MPRTINRVELLGRVGAEPEMRYTQGGHPRHPAEAGHGPQAPERRDHRRLARRGLLGKLAEAVNQYVGKGHRLYVAGRLVQSSYETENGQRRYRTEIHAQEVVFLDSRNGAGQTDDGEDAEGSEASPF